MKALNRTRWRLIREKAEEEHIDLIVLTELNHPEVLNSRSSKWTVLHSTPKVAVVALNRHVHLVEVCETNLDRMVRVRIRKHEFTYTVIGVYAPASHTRTRTAFFQENAFYRIVDSLDEIVMLGDFNTVLHADDRMSTARNESSATALRNLLTEALLEDPYVDLPGQPRMTYYHQGAPCSRLDRVYATTTTAQVTTVRHIPSVDNLDHSLVIADIGSIPPRPPKPFRFPNKLLKEEGVVATLLRILERHLVFKNQERIHHAFTRIRRYANEVMRKRRIRHLNRLEREQRMITRTELALERIVRNRLRYDSEEEFREVLAEGIRARNTARSIVSERRRKLREEKDARFAKMIAKEAQRITHPFFTWHQNDNRGPQTSMQGDNALSEIYTYFKEKGTPRVREEAAIEALAPHMISMEGVLTTPITKDEIMDGIKAMGNDKAPGTNGITAEVLKHEDLKESFTEAILEEWNKMKRGVSPHISWNEGRVRLFYKNKGSSEEVGNYRPITLLNIHRKVMSAVLMNRMKPIMMANVHPSQTGFIPERQILENIEWIRLMREKGERRNTRTSPFTFLFDIAAAFDTVSHDRIRETISNGNSMLWEDVKLLVEGAKSFVHTEKGVTPHYDIQSGVRQGCVLSPMLFALALEPFLNYVRSKFGDIIRAFADDMGAYPKQEEIIELFDCFELLQGSTGLKLNKSKTVALRHRNTRLTFRGIEGVVTSSNGVYLGAMLGSQEEEIDYGRKIIDKVKARLITWKKWVPTALGRVMIANAVGSGCLRYFVNTCTGVQKLVKQLHHLLWYWIWHGEPPEERERTTNLLALRKACLPRSKGGMSYQDPQIWYEASRIQQYQLRRGRPGMVEGKIRKEARRILGRWLQIRVAALSQMSYHEVEQRILSYTNTHLRRTATYNVPQEQRPYPGFLYDDEMITTPSQKWIYRARIRKLLRDPIEKHLKPRVPLSSLWNLDLPWVRLNWIMRDSPIAIEWHTQCILLNLKITEAKLSKFVEHIGEECQFCGQGKGDMYHIAVTCRDAQQVYRIVTTLISRLLGGYTGEPHDSFIADRRKPDIYTIMTIKVWNAIRYAYWCARCSIILDEEVYRVGMRRGGKWSHPSWNALLRHQVTLKLHSLGLHHVTSRRNTIQYSDIRSLVDELLNDFNFQVAKHPKLPIESAPITDAAP